MMSDGRTDPEDVFRSLGKSIWHARLHQEKISSALEKGRVPDKDTVAALGEALGELTRSLFLLPKPARDTIYQEMDKQNEEYMAAADARILLDRIQRRARPRTGDDIWRISKDMI